MNAKEVLEAALHLAPPERESLVHELLASLVADEYFSDESVEAAWLSEVSRRSDELDAGAAELVDWADVQARISARRAAR